MKPIILIIDDSESDIVDITSTIKNTALKDNKEIITCRSIHDSKWIEEENYKKPTLIELIKNLKEERKDIDFVFIDREFEKEFPGNNRNAGGVEAIKIIEKEFPNSIITISSRHSGTGIDDTYLEYKTFNKSGSDENDKLEVINCQIKKWQIERIKRINNPESLKELYYKLKEVKGKDQYIEHDNKTYFVDYQSKDNLFCFSKTGILKIIEDCLEYSYPKKIGNWANNNEVDLVEVYKKYIEIDSTQGYEKTKEIKEIAEKIINNRVHNHDTQSKTGNYNYTDIKISYITKEHIKNLTSLENIPEAFYGLLIWRRVILGICKYAEENSQNKFKNIKTLTELFYGSVSFTEESMKHFFRKLGFRYTNSVINSKSLLKKNCFKEENDWIFNLNFSSTETIS